MTPHGHAHDLGADAARRGRYTRAFALGIALNVVFVAVEFAFGFVADSLVLLADAGHNLSDVAGLLLAWGAFHFAERRPSRHFTYGLRKGTILAALASAVLLLVAVGAITSEAIERLADPPRVDGGVVLVVAGIGVVINAATAALFFADRGTDLNIQGAFLHMAADAAVSLGVVASGALILWSGQLWLDPVTSLVIAVVILVGTWGLLRDSVRLSLDAAPREIDLEELESWLASQPGVEDVHDLHVWAISTIENALTVHLVVDETADRDPRAVAERLRERYGMRHSTIQIESRERACAEDCAASPR